MDIERPIFLFIDLNSYFATVEQQANSALRGKPVGVCEHSGGIILAPSREAKSRGVKTAMPVWEAKKICPEIILVPVDPGKIRAMTSRFYRIAEDYSNEVEHVSVDEVSIDLTLPSHKASAGKPANWLGAIETAKEIKQRIKLEMGDWMTASIGIAESRLLAKIATNLKKPDGLVVIYDQTRNPIVKMEFSTTGTDGPKIYSKSELYDILDLIDIPGIGPRLKKSLGRHGITTLRGLSEVSLETLHSWYGISGVWLYDLSHLQDAWREVDLDDRGVKSIGHQYALGKRNAFYEKQKVLGLLWKLVEKVTKRLRKQNLFASTVSVYFGYAGGGGVGGSRRTGDLFDDSPTVVKVAETWIKDLEPRKGISFISVTVSGLRSGGRQGVLFESDRLKKEIPKTLDQINSRWGDFSIMYAPSLAAEEKAHDTVGFGRTRERLSWDEE